MKKTYNKYLSKNGIESRRDGTKEPFSYGDYFFKYKSIDGIVSGSKLVSIGGEDHENEFDLYLQFYGDKEVYKLTRCNIRVDVGERVRLIPIKNGVDAYRLKILDQAGQVKFEFERKKDISILTNLYTR